MQFSRLEATPGRANLIRIALGVCFGCVLAGCGATAQPYPESSRTGRSAQSREQQSEQTPEQFLHEQHASERPRLAVPSAQTATVGAEQQTARPEASATSNMPQQIGGIPAVSIPGLASGETPPPTEQDVQKAVGNWFYGPGLGQTVLNVGAVVAFPPYAVYLIGNAGLSLAGFQQLFITDLLPEQPREVVLTAYDGVTSVPGRMTSFVAGRDYYQPQPNVQSQPGVQNQLNVQNQPGQKLPDQKGLASNVCTANFCTANGGRASNDGQNRKVAGQQTSVSGSGDSSQALPSGRSGVNAQTGVLAAGKEHPVPCRNEHC